MVRIDFPFAIVNINTASQIIRDLLDLLATSKTNEALCERLDLTVSLLDLAKKQLVHSESMLTTEQRDLVLEKLARWVKEKEAHLMEIEALKEELGS